LADQGSVQGGGQSIASKEQTGLRYKIPCLATSELYLTQVVTACKTYLQQGRLTLIQMRRESGETTMIWSQSQLLRLLVRGFNIRTRD
jgi:hypothetical protein